MSTTKLGPVEGCTAIILLIVIGAMWTGWLLMLTLGVIHSWNPDVPTLGYATAVPIGALFNAVIGRFK